MFERPAGTIRIVVDGRPVPKGTARTVHVKGRVMSFTPTHTRQYMDVLKLAAQRVMDGAPLLEGPLNLAVRAIIPPPASMSKKKLALALSGALRPITRPDLSNFIKLAEDALNLVVWRDDSQVVSYEGSGKWYGARPRLEIEVAPIEPTAVAQKPPDLFALTG